MRRNEQDDAVMFGVVVVVAVIGFLLWTFSDLLGLDVATGTQLLLSLIVVAVVFIALTWWLNIFEAADVAPAALAGVWFCCWPAMTYWAAALVPPFARSGADPTVWWNAWYTKWGVLAAILAVGYGWRSRQRSW